MKHVIVSSVLSVFASTATADEIHLKNGNRIEGIARIEGDRVVVELSIGTASMARTDVVRIVPGRLPLHDYEGKLKNIEGSANPADWFDLAVWAKVNGLTRYVTPLLERVIALDPDHKRAREMLGYVHHLDRWMTKPQFMEVQGFVWFRDQWVTKADRDAVLAQEAARRELAKAAADRRRSEATPAPVRVPILYMGIPPYRDVHCGNAWTSRPRVIWRGHFGGHHHSPVRHEGRHNGHRGHR